MAQAGRQRLHLGHRHTPIQQMAYRQKPEVSPRARAPMIRAPRSKSKVPVSKVPAEILIQIFENLVEDEVVDHLPPWKLYKRHKGWLHAAATCRRWHTIAKHTPGLWRTIDVGDDPRTLFLSLDRSRATTIDITFHTPEVIPPTLGMLSRNASRIRKLVVVALDQSTMSVLSPLLSSAPMPELRELWINTLPHFTDHESFPELNPYLVPNLRVLEVTHLRFNWYSPIVSRLRQLYLGRSPGQGCLRFDDFLRVLGSCPTLEFLKIDRAFPLYHEAYRSRLLLPLPHLRRLHLVTEHPPEVHELLSHVRLDARANIDVTVRIELEGSDDRFAATGLLDVIPQDSSCLPILRSAVYAHMTDFDFECWGPKGQGRLAVTFVEVQAGPWQYIIEDAARHTGQLLKHAPVDALTVCQEWSDPLLTKDLVQLLGRLPHLTTLEYSGLDVEETDLAAALMPTSPLSASADPRPYQSVSEVPVPRLRTLRVVRTGWEADFLPLVKECLRARYVQGSWLESLHVELQGRVPDPGAEMTHAWAVGEIEKLVRGPVRIYG